MSQARVFILCAPGTNRARDLAEAFQVVGAQPVLITMSEVLAAPERLREAQLLALPGGFSYGDALGAGRVWGLQLKLTLGDVIREHLAAQRPILGICNGFQAMVHLGLFGEDGDFSLGPNQPAGFQCRWVELRVQAQRNAWAQALAGPSLHVPIAHGEGRLIAATPHAREALRTQAVLRYVPTMGEPSGWPGNPNGSVEDVAGLCDASGWALGLMPHPENALYPWQAPSPLAAPHLGPRLFEAALSLIR